MTKRISPKPIGVTLEELDTALAQEQRPAVRQRLRTVKMMLLGASTRRAAEFANVHPTTVLRWIKLVRRQGCPALQERQFRDPALASDEATDARAKIKAALESKPDRRTQLRLTAVDKVLAGTSLERAAAEANVKRSTMRTWYWRFSKNGVAGLIGDHDYRTRFSQQNTKGDQLRDLAAREPDRAIAKRLLAVANVLDGMGMIDAAARAKVSDHTVRLCMLRYEKGGVEALRYKRKGRKLMLSADQVNALREIVLARPEVTYAKLVTMVQLRFKVSYTPGGIMRLLKDRFGFVRNRGVFKFVVRPPLKAKVSGLQARVRTLVDASALSRGLDRGMTARAP